MLSTPKTSRMGRPSIGEPSRISRVREQSPGAVSAGSVEDASTSSRPVQAGSMIGGTLRHSTSARGNPAGRNSRDPRPVGDKGYTAQCARTVVDFLVVRGFGRTITFEKFLREPITKDYFEIFKFLIAQLDPQLEVGGKIEEEVPSIMKRLRYPVEVNKSKLMSISGPNTWPQLLAVLDWLITLIQVNDTLIQPLAECTLGLADADEEVDANHNLLRALHDNYILFLSGKDDHSIEERLREIYEERAGTVQLEVDRLEEQMAGMAAQLQDFRSEHDRLLEIQAAPANLEIEADRLRSAIQAQDAGAQRAEENLLAAEADEQTTLAEIEGFEVRCKQLQEQVASQSYSTKDIERLKCERTHLRRMLQDLKCDAEKADQNVWELGIEESRLEEAISRNVRYVNEKAETVEDVATVAGDACAKELKVHVDVSEPTDALAALDFTDLSKHMEKVDESQNEAARQEDAVVHEVGQEQMSAQEELSQKERLVERLKQRRLDFTRMREEYRVWSDNELDDARQMAEVAEDNARTAAIVTAAPTLRDFAEVDELRLQLTEAKAAHEGDVKIVEEKLQKEKEIKDRYVKETQKEMRLGLESMEQLRDDVETRIGELGTVDCPEGAERPPPSRGGC